MTAGGRQGPRRGLVVFTKPAVAGRVKTRMIGPFSGEQAAELHAAFLEDLLAAAREARVDVHVAWALQKGEELPSTSTRPESVLDRVEWAQVGPDLGARLVHGLRRAAETHELVAAVGSDHPEATAEELDEIFDALEDGAEAVIRPSDDGGYTSIGVRCGSLNARLFEGIAWSTERVLTETLDRCRELGLRVKLLSPGRDIDTPEDLEGLVTRLAAQPGSCPATRAVLASWGLLEVPSMSEARSSKEPA